MMCMLLVKVTMLREGLQSEHLDGFDIRALNKFYILSSFRL